MTMKRILGVLCLVAVLFSACKKDKDGEKKSFNENDLIGYWACYESVESNGTVNSNPPYAFAAYHDHTFQYSSEIDHAPCSWEFDGNDVKLEIDGVDKTTLTQLDGKHLTWIQNWMGDDYTDSYTNISRILPGKWIISWPSATYDVEIEDNGHSTWLQEGTTEVLYVDWTLDLYRGRVVVCFGDDNSSLSDELTLTAINEDFLTSTNRNCDRVSFARQ